MLTRQCLCFSQKAYAECCQPYHRGQSFPASPDLLMRSRFSAYAKGLTDYIIQTTHPLNEDAQTPTEERASDIAHFSRTTSFDGLEVIAAGLREGDEEWGWVHFKATLNQGGHDASFEEVSHFTFDDEGHWAYVDGDIVVEED